MATTNLDKWHKALEKCESQELFIDWAFYALISAALERRVCYCEWPTLAGPTALFTNLYTIFVGPPGCGKSMPASMAKAVFKTFPGFESENAYVKQLITIAPNSVSVQALWSRMATKNSLYKIAWKDMPEAYPPHAIHPDGRPKVETFIYISSPIAVIADQELGSFLPEYSKDTVNFLQEAYIAGDFEDLKISSGSRFLKNCCMTLFGCTNPEWIIEATRNKLLQQGLAARTIFVYGDKKRFREPHFSMDEDAKQAFKEIAQHVEVLAKLFGKAEPSPEAKAWFDNWYMKGGDEPINKSEKLVDYYTRKRVHLIKLAMVMHFAESTSMTIELEDFKRAALLLARTEITMHKALAGSGMNPAYDVADRILAQLAQSNGCGVSGVQLLARVFAYCPQGRDTFESAIEYLNVTEQIDPGEDHNGRPVYKRKEI